MSLKELASFHTWHLIRMIMLRANIQYHSGGISSGRSPMSYVYDAWAIAFPYTGPQLIHIPLDELTGELELRSPLKTNDQHVFTEIGLIALDAVEITALVVRVIAQGHVFFRKKCGWEGLGDSEFAVRAVRKYFGDFLPNKNTFLCPNLFKQAHVRGADLKQLRMLVEELHNRQGRVVIDPHEGLIPVALRKSDFLA